MAEPDDGLDSLDKAILQLESEHWKYRGAKESAIRQRLASAP